MRLRNLLYQFYHLIWISVDLLLPPTCAGCGAPGSRWCAECRRHVIRPREPVCEVCGMPIWTGRRVCADCARRRPSYRALRSWSAFEGPVRQALHRLKYRRDMGVGEALAAELSQFAAGLDLAIDVVVPVPLGKRRLNERGYNQVGLFAWPVAMALGLAYAPDALVRTRETLSQVGLTRAERHDNVHGAFEGRQRWVSGRGILLMDDVATTGSTLSSCAEALHAAGAQDVFALTIARALPAHGSTTGEGGRASAQSPNIIT